MQISRSKTIATTITLCLVLTIAITLVALPTANAHYPAWTIPTWSYISVTNNVIGVNQQFTIVFWLNAVPVTAQGAYGDRWTFNLEVTKPDGSKETVGPITSDPVGGGWTNYVPTQVGTYSLVAKFVEHVITGQPLNPTLSTTAQNNYAYWNDTYSASASNPIYVTVQQEAIQPWPEAPLPTQFWTRPISDLNRNWAPLAANWLSGAAHNVGPTTNFAYGSAPESAHIMWTRPIWAGGIMDARFGDIGYQTFHYEGLGFSPPIILNGKLFYNVQSLPREGWYCVDLYTGETDYFFNTTGPITVTAATQGSSGSISQQSLAFGQILNYECPNQHGGMPYLWSTTGPGSTWMMYDAFTGNYICSIANVSSSGTAVYGKDGSILRYNMVGSGANKRLTVWNTTRAIWYKSTFTGNNYWTWRPGLNVTYDGNNGFSLNASIPDVQGTIRAVREDKYMIGGTAGKNNGTYVLQGNLWALNLKPDANGVITPTLLWNITFTPPQQLPDIAIGGSFSAGSMSMGAVDPEDGVFLFSETMTLRRWGYSLATGQMLWGPTAPEPSLNYYGMMSNIYEGKLLSLSYGGELIAYNITTGKIIWTYNCSQVGFESPYGNYPSAISNIADGKIYIGCGEHSPTQPMWRGPNLRCINASNGVELWKIADFGCYFSAGGNAGSYFAIADGFLLALNAYDNQIYCFGKGPSATTVSASPKIVVDGNDVMIEGKVTDQSPESKDTPAIADESMSAWMEYLFEQQAMPTNAIGVEVTLDTIDPNGNFIHIGTVTSDMSGMFKKMWQPEVPGEYTVIATFAGSKSYYSSYTETSVGVSEAPAATPTPEPEAAQPPLDMYLLFATVAIIIAIAVVGLLLLRKK